MDRISALPNEILCQILSFLPTKEAVATCVLSKRWENVWVSLSIIDIDDQLVFNDGYWNNHGVDANNPNLFKGFVDRVFLLSDSTVLNRFCFNVGEICNLPYVCDWIHAAVVKFKMPMMNICVSVDDFKFESHKSLGFVAELPENLFSSETLEGLELSWWNVSIQIPISFYLPRLKFLSISMFNPSLDFTEHLFSSCPLLEKLHISIQLRYLKSDLEGYKDERKLVVSSASLREVQVFWTVELPFVGYNLNHDHQVVINCPKAVYLNVRDQFMAKYTGEDMPEIVEANVDYGVGCVCIYSDDDQDEDRFLRVQKLFASMARVRSLCLSYATVCVFQFPGDLDLPSFENLTKLEMSFSDCINLELLLLVFFCAPYLKDLILNKIRGHRRPEGLDRSDSEFPEPPFSVVVSLKTIQFFGLDGWNDLYMIKFFLQKSAALRYMKLSSRDKGALKEIICNDKYVFNNFDSDRTLEFRYHILRMPRFPNCVIQFDGDF